VQTMTAVFAVSTLFVPVLAPLESVLRPFAADPENVKPPPGIVLIPAAVLSLWLLIAQVRIVRSAFEWTFFPSLVFILAQYFASAILLSLLFGVPRPDA
jgi:hypothetical protein